MKKVFLTLCAGALLSASLISCGKKCGHCEVGGVSGPSYCESTDQATYDQYKEACDTTTGATWVTVAE